jgi:hypothetical protein
MRLVETHGSAIKADGLARDRRHVRDHVAGAFRKQNNYGDASG